MRSSVAILATLLLATSCHATPMTWSGDYATAVDEESSSLGYEYLSLPALAQGLYVIQLALNITPNGGHYLEEINSVFFQTTVAVALRILDVAGDVIETLNLQGRASGPNAAAFSLAGHASIDHTPAAFELFIEGRDALVHWGVTLCRDNSDPFAVTTETVPEPATILTLLVGGAALTIRRRSMAGI